MPQAKDCALLAAIYEDDVRAVKRLLATDPTLSAWRVGKAKLYRGKILHWLYVGDTALHLAAAGHRAEIVGLLLAAGADPNARMNHRESGPLHYAADGNIDGRAWDSEKQVRVIKLLLAAGAGINAPDKNGATPLHRAVRTRCAKAVKCLLEAECDPSARNKPGSPPFHLAVQNTGRGGSGSEKAKIAQREIIEIFLSFGVSTKSKDGKGKSVFDCAQSEWVRDMLRRRA